MAKNCLLCLATVLTVGAGSIGFFPMSTWAAKQELSFKGRKANEAVIMYEAAERSRRALFSDSLLPMLLKEMGQFPTILER
jgi:hypothetical protein